MTFPAPFALSERPDELPAGAYEIVVEEELVQGLSFEAWRRAATCLTVRNHGGQAGRTEMRAIAESDLTGALSRGQVVVQRNSDSEAALFPQEDLK